MFILFKTHGICVFVFFEERSKNTFLIFKECLEGIILLWCQRLVLDLSVFYLAFLPLVIFGTLKYMADLFMCLLITNIIPDTEGKSLTGGSYFVVR